MIIKIKFILIIIAVVLILSGCYSTSGPSSHVKSPTVTTIKHETAKRALDIALEQKGTPYLWGGNGPDSFDCSGFIVYTYRKSVGRDVIFRIGDMPSRDVAMGDLYNWNVKMITEKNIIPGDILFFTRKKGEITHGGLFIDWIDFGEKFLYIHASSSHGKVLIDSWKLESKENYRFVGAGRLKKFVK